MQGQHFENPSVLLGAAQRSVSNCWDETEQHLQSCKPPQEILLTLYDTSVVRGNSFDPPSYV